ncbi:molecular chaperone [Malassezia psittaci]|uniref:Molecular chaperone n=1 Tax=Malassezia psittaci TaxID=1821823 RepID=A0AAF0JCJ6_9BASI|nr:molecular chaperone [Malassezia psittaci]
MRFLSQSRLTGSVAHSQWSLLTPGLVSSPHCSSPRVCRAYSSAQTKACASCGTPNGMAALQCKKCEALQPLPGDVSFYDVLGSPRETISRNGWSIDPNQLKGQWRQKMALTHPDRLGARPEKEQQIGTQQSAIVNKAYETLLRPLPRALYLLEQEGVKDIDEAASLEDLELLMEVMELQERLSEATDQAEVDAVGDQNQEHISDVLHQLDDAFAQSNLDKDRIQNLAIQLRYWTNIAKAVQEWQPGQPVELHH